MDTSCNVEILAQPKETVTIHTLYLVQPKMGSLPNNQKQIFQEVLFKLLSSKAVE